MKPTKKQLESISHLINDYDGKTHGEIAQDVWDYIVSELNKVYPLPSRIFIHGNMMAAYKCKQCLEEKSVYAWHQEIIQNVTQLTCPECGAVHSEMIKGDG